jgi:hypothetical protein
MKPQTKETLKQVLFTAVFSAIVAALIAKYKDLLPACISKHFKE